MSRHVTDVPFLPLFGVFRWCGCRGAWMLWIYMDLIIRSVRPDRGAGLAGGRQDAECWGRWASVRKTHGSAEEETMKSWGGGSGRGRGGRLERRDDGGAGRCKNHLPPLRRRRRTTIRTQYRTLQHHSSLRPCCIIRRFSHILLLDRKSTRLNSSHSGESRMPSSA